MEQGGIRRARGSSGRNTTQAHLVYVVLARRVARIASLLLLRPIRVELVDLARNFPVVDEVVRLPHLGEAAAPDEAHQHVALVQNRVVFESRRCARVRAEESGGGASETETE